MWAVLTTDGKEHGRWSAEEFFATGRAEIEMILAGAAQRSVTIRRGVVLDFGCGVGRLSQALADHFARVDGVDIAPSMLVAARRLDHHPGRVFYHLNAEPHLRLFTDATFDFVYSTLVLQHMAPESAKGYIAEFCRLLRSGGVAVFQLPSDQATVDSPPDATRTTGAAPLPAAQRRAQLSVSTPPGPLAAGSRFTLEVTARNVGTTPWPCRGQNDSRFAVTVGGRYLDGWRRPLHKGSVRVLLPHDLLPGSAVTVLVSLLAPAANGTHVLQLDVVQEHVAWFSDCGSPPALVAVEVVGGGAAAGPGPAPLAVSYPRLSKLAAALGAVAARRFLRAQYWRLRRFARQRRDAFRRRTASTPIMEVSYVPRAEVEAVVRSGGARVMDVETHVIEGGLRSRRYWVTK